MKKSSTKEKMFSQQKQSQQQERAKEKLCRMKKISIRTTTKTKISPTNLEQVISLKNEAAKSGNRPRFKQQINNSNRPYEPLSTMNAEDEVGGLEESRANSNLLSSFIFNIRELQQQAENMQRKEEKLRRQKQQLQRNWQQNGELPPPPPLSLLSLNKNKTMNKLNWSVVISIIAILLMLAAISTANCDIKLRLNKYNGNEESSSILLRRHKRTGSSDKDLVVGLEPVKSTASNDNEKIQKVVITGSNNNNFINNKSMQDEHTIKVAAYATKLEHWFNCHKQSFAAAAAAATATSSPAPQDNNVGAEIVLDTGSNQNDKQRLSNNPGPSKYSAAVSLIDDELASADGHTTFAKTDARGALTGKCQPDYDGHLCWPAAKVGETVKLPCPKLNWLPVAPSLLSSDADNKDLSRQQELKSSSSKPESSSVINSIQPAIGNSNDNDRISSRDSIALSSSSEQQQQHDSVANSKTKSQSTEINKGKSVDQSVSLYVDRE